MLWWGVTDLTYVKSHTIWFLRPATVTRTNTERTPAPDCSTGRTHPDSRCAYRTWHSRRGRRRSRREYILGLSLFAPFLTPSFPSLPSSDERVAGHHWTFPPPYPQAHRPSLGRPRTRPGRSSLGTLLSRIPPSPLTHPIKPSRGGDQPCPDGGATPDPCPPSRTVTQRYGPRLHSMACGRGGGTLWQLARTDCPRHV